MGLRAVAAAFLACFLFVAPARAAMVDEPVVRLQSLNKATARTMTFEVNVGSTVKFGPIYIKVQACRKAPPTEQPESAAFLQIWQVTPKGQSKWIFSGWMFASSPALSAMDHPIYDVWVLDCLPHKSTGPAANGATAQSGKAANETDQSAPLTVHKNAEITGASAQPPADIPALPGQMPSAAPPVVTLPGEGGAK